MIKINKKNTIILRETLGPVLHTFLRGHFCVFFILHLSSVSIFICTVYYFTALYHYQVFILHLHVCISRRFYPKGLTVQSGYTGFVRKQQILRIRDVHSCSRASMFFKETENEKLFVDLKRFLKPLFLRVKGLESDEGSARHFYATRVIFASRPFVALHHDKTTRWHSDCDLHCAYDHNLWFTSPVRLSGSR